MRNALPVLKTEIKIKAYLRENEISYDGRIEATLRLLCEEIDKLKDKINEKRT